MILEISSDQIATLNDVDLRTLLAYLCEREVKAHGQSPAAVTWGGHQNAGDGGIDVRVRLPCDAPISGYIPKFSSGFQVKAQDMAKGAILDEMAPDGVLRPSIVSLAAEGGAYIIVASKGSMSDTSLKSRQKAMAKAVAGLPTASSLTLDFYDRRRIASWANQHPGLVPWIRQRLGLPLSGWRPFEDWSSFPAPLDSPYLPDPDIRVLGPSIAQEGGLNAEEALNELRKILASPKGIIRFVGLSGVGKTRFVQALFDSRIGTDPLLPSDALYTDMSDNPEPPPQELLSQCVALDHRVVVIVDNCSVELHRKLALTMASSECRLSLITIEYDINDDEPPNSHVFRLEPASNALIEKLLAMRYPGLSAPSRGVIVACSEGNARVAFALAETAKHGETLTGFNDTELFHRLFHQQKAPSAELMSAATACALVYSFDGETLEGTDSELVVLAPLVGQSVDQLYKNIAELHRRKLVQKRARWRAILPHALANRLANLAFEDIPLPRIEKTFIAAAPPRLLRSFSRRIGYLHQTPTAVSLVKQWFAPGGLLASLGRHTEPQEAIFDNVAPTDPHLTLAFIETAAQSSSTWFFEKQNRNAAQVVRILRSIAYDSTLFERCVKLLTQFALAQCAPSTDEDDLAVQVLRSLCWINTSGTHASLDQRALLVGSLLSSTVAKEQDLGVSLLDAMLESSNFTPSGSYDFGAWNRDFGLRPETESDVRAWFSRTLQLALSAESKTSVSKSHLRHVVAAHVTALLVGGLVVEVTVYARTVVEAADWPEGWIGVRKAIKRSKTVASEGAMQQLEQLEKLLRPSALASLVRAHALSEEWSTLDIADFDGDEGKDTSEVLQEVAVKCIDLGQQLAADEAVLQTLLPEILTSKSQRTAALGLGLATACASLAAHWRLLRDRFITIPAESRNVQILCGFMEGAMARSHDEAEALLDDALATVDLHPYLLQLQINAGVRGRAFARLVYAMALNTVPLSSFAYLKYGRAHEGLNDEQFSSIVRGLLERPAGARIAGEILGMRIFGLRADKQAISEPLRTVAIESLLKLDLEKSAQLDHDVGSLISVALNRDEYEGIARIICSKLLAALRGWKVHAWDYRETIMALAKSFPVVVLDVLVEEASMRKDSGRPVLHDLTRYRSNPLIAISTPVWMAWAAQKPETRYELLARIIPFSNRGEDDAAEGWSSAAMQLIEQAPNPVPVLESFLRRFIPNSWSGSRATLTQTRAPLIESLRKHPNPDIAAWAGKHSAVFAQQIERERAMEAADTRGYDQRFE